MIDTHSAPADLSIITVTTKFIHGHSRAANASTNTYVMPESYCRFGM